VISPLLRSYLPDRPIVVVDVGAHSGGFFGALQEQVPIARAVLVESMPDYAAKLRDRAWGTDVRVVDRAVADTDGNRVEFTINAYSETSSLLELRRDLSELSNIDTRVERRISVETITLDRLYADQDLTAVDLLKIDVQGAELLVLKGAGRALSNSEMVWIETSFKPLYEGSALFAEVYDQLGAAGFELREISPGHRAPTGELLQADLLFVKRGSKLRPRPQSPAPGWRTFARRALGFGMRMAERFPRRAASPLGTASFSQCGEDLIVRYVLALRGITRPSYLDVGAHDPFYLSNTALLYKLGGRGINIDPNRDLIAAFQRARPDDVNLCLAVGAGGGSLDLFVFEDGTLSTCSPAEAKELQSHGHKQLRIDRVPVKPLAELIAEHARDRFPDFLSLDVEGLEKEILAPLGGRRDLPKVMAVETAEYSPTGSGKKRQDLIDFIRGIGYAVYADTNLNTIFVHRDFWTP
jgi:FkbM family methyltransferase